MPFLVYRMTGENGQPKMYLMAKLLLVFSLTSSFFWITTQVLIQKFNISTKQKMETKFVTFFNSKIMTCTLSFVAIFVLLNVFTKLNLGSLMILHECFGLFADVLLINVLISSDEAMIFIKRKYLSWANGILFVDKKIHPRNVNMSVIPIPEVPNRTKSPQELNVQEMC